MTEQDTGKDPDKAQVEVNDPDSVKVTTDAGEQSAEQSPDQPAPPADDGNA